MLYPLHLVLIEKINIIHIFNTCISTLSSSFGFAQFASTERQHFMQRV